MPQRVESRAVDRRLIILGGFAAVLAAIVIVVAVAGGGDDGDGGGTATFDPGSKPEVEAPQGDPPTELVVEDLTEGEGREVEAGDRVGVQYVGVDFETGQEFDTSWRGDEPGQPFELAVGAGEVIPGWDEGLEGMKLGGRRRLVIPPDLAYGPQGQPPDIGPNATLVFVIDLVSAPS